MHFNRRSLFGTAAVLSASGAHAALKNDMEPRGAIGILERLPTMELEANEEFLASFRVWVNGTLSRAAEARANDICKAKGIDPQAEMPMDQAVALLQGDSVIGFRNHSWSHCQHLTWQNLYREFHANYDAYMSEMEAADKIGPGTLELSDQTVIPQYAKHEYHTQPGGYVGDPFAGHVYHYLVNNFHEGRNNQDEQAHAMAAGIPLPADGKVKRILDTGCGIGRVTVALKKRFPDAEVWGIDVGAPLVRYGHMRAADMGVDVNFAHRIAEDTRFPDNHFDIVFSYILHHEVPAEASKAILKETHRILRPGGFYYPQDFYTTGRKPPTAPYPRLREWVSHRWVHEPWMLEYAELDMPGEMKKAGFVVEEGGKGGMGGNRGNLKAVKPA